jgi:hypothetical protein
MLVDLVSPPVDAIMAIVIREEYTKENKGQCVNLVKGGGGGISGEYVNLLPPDLYQAELFVEEAGMPLTLTLNVVPFPLLPKLGLVQVRWGY